MPVGPSVNPMWLGSVSTASPTQEDIAKGCCRHPAGEAQDGGQDQEREAVPSAVERPSVTLDPQGENPEKRNRLMFLGGLGPKARGKGRGREEMQIGCRGGHWLGLREHTTFANPHGIPASGDPVPFSGLCGHLHAQTYTYTELELRSTLLSA